MNTELRIRRSALLCCHFIRNLSYYRAGWINHQVKFPRNEIWATINNNFLDVAVLEWCKLFADGRAKHCYKKVVLEPSNFLPQLLFDYGGTLSEWDGFLKLMRAYRDKFIAHLDSDLTMNIPKMDLAEFSVHYFYDTIKAEQNGEIFDSLPYNLKEYASSCEKTASKSYADAS